MVAPINGLRKSLSERVYDAYLLMDIDIPWRPDPQREHPELREHFFSVYKSYLEEHNLLYSVVRGIEGDRLKSALAELNLAGS